MGRKDPYSKLREKFVSDPFDFGNLFLTPYFDPDEGRAKKTFLRLRRELWSQLGLELTKRGRPEGSLKVDFAECMIIAIARDWGTLRPAEIITILRAKGRYESVSYSSYYHRLKLGRATVRKLLEAVDAAESPDLMSAALVSWFRDQDATVVQKGCIGLLKILPKA